jgi:hypothetical protein
LASLKEEPPKVAPVKLNVPLLNIAPPFPSRALLLLNVELVKVAVEEL